MELIIMETEYDKFYPTLWKQGDSIVLTVPFNLVEGLGFKVGDKVKVMIKKVA